MEEYKNEQTDDSTPRALSIVGAGPGTATIYASREQIPVLVNDTLKAYGYQPVDLSRWQGEKPKEPTVQTNRRKREIKLPSRAGDAYKWVLIWDILGPELDKDPALAIDYRQLLGFLTGRIDNIPKEPTMKDIISLGRQRGIPERAEFERENRL